MAGALEIVTCLVRIVGPLLDAIGEERVGFVDREVVADRGMAEQDLVDHLLAVDRQLQRHSEIGVVRRAPCCNA